MGVVNFSVPEKIKKAFNQAFRDENKSAVLARLMQQAIDERQRQKRRAAAADAVLKLHRRARPVGDSAIRRERRRGRG